MNYDILTWIEYFVGSFACCFGMLIVGMILLERKFKDLKIYNYLLILALSIFMVFNSLVFDNILKIFGNLLIFAVIFKFIFNEKSIKVFIYSVVIYIIFLSNEIVFAWIVAMLDYILKLTLISFVAKSFVGNIIISIFACITAYFLKRKINHYVEKISKANILVICLQIFITLFIILSSLNYLYMDNWKFSYKFILNTIIIFGSSVLTFTLLKQYLKTKEVVAKHQLLEEYMKTSADLIEKYSSTIHKYKNNLIAIKGYMKSDMKEANRYVDSLLENYKTKKYSWFSKINYISIDTIRYLIYYKLSKAEELNLKISVNVSKDIKNIKNNLLNSHELGNILEILGEYFDNANYASNESKEKELNFDLYLENDKINFIISNTYKEKMDLNLISKNGYTTKGKGHGLGLYDVEKTIKNMNFLISNYEIIDNYFVVTLMINLSNLHK